MYRIFLGFTIALFGNTIQCQTKTFFIENKGVYINYERKDKNLKIPFKEGEEFFFCMKNDSIALIQNIYKGISGKIEEYKISPNYDTAYIKRYSTVNSKKVFKTTKIVFQKVYK